MLYNKKRQQNDSTKFKVNINYEWMKCATFVKNKPKQFGHQLYCTELEICFPILQKLVDSPVNGTFPCSCCFNLPFFYSEAHT